ncbi:MAG: hypothetical protein JNL21_28810 [Myxococcales bacterium]|nr:hypothetical protein [Myxococcales bacterium]
MGVTRERRASGYQLALVVALLPGAAGAQESAAPVEIAIEVPQGCPDSEAIRQETERLLGTSPRPEGVRLRASGAIARRGDRYELDLTIERGSNRIARTLEARSCETAADVAALLISLAVAPDSVGTPEPSGAPTPPAPVPERPASPEVHAPPPLPASLDRARTATTPARRDLLGFAVRAGPLFGVADLPFPQVGGQIAAALRIEAWTIEAGFEGGYGANRIVENRPDAGASFLRLVGLLRGCRVLAPFVAPAWPRPMPGVDFSACAGVEVGQISGETFGVFIPERASGLWLAPQLDLRLGIGITPPLSLVPHAGLAFPLTRPSFLISANEPKPILVHQPGPVAGRAGITFEAQF